jgi:hypothetical protein
LWCAVPLLASLGVVTGVAGTALPEDAIAQERGDENGLLPGAGKLLPAPPGLSGSSSEPTTSAPGSSQPDPPTSSEQRRPSLPLLSPPSGDKPGLLPPPSGDKPGLLPPPSGDKPGLLPPPPPAPQLSLPTGGPADATPGPGRGWTLTGSSLKLGGSHYHGYSQQQVGGETVKTLHFTVDRLEITDLVQRGDLGNGKIVRTSSAPGAVSTVVDGPIELQTQELSGTLSVAGLPVLPLNLSPDSLSLPNLDLSFLQLPDLTFKDVVVHNAELSGGKLHIPGARIGLE